MGDITRAHVFVERDGLMLALQQAASWRWWECPGGDVEAGETPAEAAAREVFEETGLRITTPRLLRQWEYEDRHSRRIAAYVFAARSTAGDVALSAEHSEYEWLSAADYAGRRCAESSENLPDWMRRFLAEMRLNCRLFDRWLQERRAHEQR